MTESAHTEAQQLSEVHSQCHIRNCDLLYMSRFSLQEEEEEEKKKGSGIACGIYESPRDRL